MHERRLGRASEVTRLTREHDAYRWICGGVAVNYHAPNDSRGANDALMDELLSDNVAAPAAVGAITLERVAQDGMRVRADAGAASFRRQARLEEHQAEARELVRTLKTQAQADPGQASRRAQAARLRAAQQREQRIADAPARLPAMEAANRRNGDKPEDARSGTTHADASNMKMGDGGFRPAYNVQFATDCASQVIVGVDAVTAGSDMAQLAPMVAQVEQRLGRTPGQWLVDGGFPAHAQIDAVAGKTELYSPVPRATSSKGRESARAQVRAQPSQPLREATDHGPRARNRSIASPQRLANSPAPSHPPNRPCVHLRRCSSIRLGSIAGSPHGVR